MGEASASRRAGNRPPPGETHGGRPVEGFVSGLFQILMVEGRPAARAKAGQERFSEGRCRLFDEQRLNIPWQRQPEGTDALHPAGRRSARPPVAYESILPGEDHPHPDARPMENLSEGAASEDASGPTCSSRECTSCQRENMESIANTMMKN